VIEPTLAPGDVRPRKRRRFRNLLLLLTVLGPGFVTASAGNDVGGIATYSIAGAQFGYAILWVMVPLTVALIIVQEMAARMGVATGKGLAALIREQLGVRITFVAMLSLLFVNTFIAASEFAGIAAAAEIYHVSRYIAVPVTVALVLLLVLRLNAKRVEQVFVVFSLVYLCYIVSALLAHPDWRAVGRGLIVPTVDLHDSRFLVTVVGIIGTTISPYMQFFLQSSIVERGARVSELAMTRLDVITGSILGMVIAVSMIIANAATIFVRAQAQHQTVQITQAADVAVALQPLAGPFAADLFAFGIINAGLFTATVLPLATSYLVCEALGFEASLDRKVREAPVFFAVLGFGIIAGAALVLVPGIPLLPLIFDSQVVQGILLPLELVLMMIIINRTGVMGKFVNSRSSNIIGWATVIIVGTLALGYAIQQILSGGS
jgi:NRAMP (natural resistance-associated macrophage protein)-like metal ion transporter